MKLIVKAIFVSFIYSLFTLIIMIVGTGAFTQDNDWFFGWLVSVGLTLLLVYGFFVIGGLVLVGLPVHFLFQKFSIRTAFPYCIIGMSFPIGIVLYFQPYGSDPLPQLAGQAILSGVVGCVCAYTFWLEAVKKGNLRQK